MPFFFCVAISSICFSYFLSLFKDVLTTEYTKRALKIMNENFNEELTSWTKIMLVHEGDGKRVFCMQSALVSITPIHRIHHVSHLLPGVPHSILAFFSKLAAKANTKGKPECEAWRRLDNSSKWFRNVQG